MVRVAILFSLSLLAAHDGHARTDDLSSLDAFGLVGGTDETALVITNDSLCHAVPILSTNDNLHLFTHFRRCCYVYIIVVVGAKSQVIDPYRYQLVTNLRGSRMTNPNYPQETF